VVTQATADQGTKQSITLNDNTTYSLSFYALGSGTALSTMEAGYSSDGSTDNTVCITAQTVSTSTWTNYTCSFTTPATHSGTPYLYIKNTAATVRTVFLDNIQLTTGNTFTAYREGTISLNGIIVSPTTYQNQTNSTTAFQIQNTSGGNLFQIDTLNSNITLNGGNSGMVQAWQTGSNTGLTATNDNGSIIVNGYMYLIGGNNGSADIATVQYSKIQASGGFTSPGSCANTWCPTTSLPAIRDGFGTATANGYIYVVGGSNNDLASGSVSTVYYAKINADGTVGSWKTNAYDLSCTTTVCSPAAIIPRYMTVTTAYNGYLFAFSGSDINGAPRANSYSAKINADGSTGPWVSINAVNTAHMFGSIAVANGYAYVLGGLSSGVTAQATVQYAKLNTDGTTGTWATTTAMPTALFEVGTAVINGNIYYTGGYTSSYASRSAATMYASLNANGTIGNWSCQGKT
jgi:hypothetical protein